MDGQSENGEHAETKRGRVRRLLLGPLGFRHPRGTDEADGRKALDRIADDLGYMADDRLAALCDMLRSHGQGSARNLWPDHATFVGFAEVVQPRPLEELPALLRWLGSVEGPRALAAGTLVETVEYVRGRKVPPVTPQARQLVAEKAAENARRLVIIGERRAAGLGIAPSELAWEGWYLDQRAAAEALVAREQAVRGHGSEGAAA